MTESAWWPGADIADRTTGTGDGEMGGGEMGSRVRAFDWSATPLGPPQSWPPTLANVVTLLLDAGHPAMVVWGPELTTLYNDGFIPILGARHPCLGQPLRSVLAELWTEYQPLVEATLRGKSHYFVDRPVQTEDSAQPTRWFTFSWTPLRNAARHVMGFYCATLETTESVLRVEQERRDSLQALASTESRYQSLFNSIDEGFCIVEMKFAPDGEALDYRFVEINPAFENQTGLHEAKGTWMRELEPAHEQYWFDTYGEVAKTGRSIRFVSHAEALGRWFSVNAFPVPDGVPPSQVAILFQDITERRRAELALREADRRKDEFIATLAHELRNPLAPIRSGLDIVKLKSGAASPLQSTIGIMERQLAHLVRLVDDLLDIGRISSGKLQLKNGPVRLQEVLDHTVQALHATKALHRHQLSIMAPADVPPVWGDFERLNQAFTNIVSNAIKYTDAGGRIRITLESQGRDVVARVADTGIGISAHELSRVFDLFWQVRSDHDRTGGGLGIGLSLVKKIVSLHGGQVSAESRGPGQGSIFTVRLPAIATQAEGVQPAPLHHSPGATTAKRILVADDNEDAARALAELLRCSGHEVFTAFNGEEAVESAVQLRPDVILLDIGMPVMDGMEAARQIRSRIRHPRPTLAALTGWGQDSDRQATIEAGFDHHLVKPASLDTLDEVLNAPLAR